MAAIYRQNQKEGTNYESARGRSLFMDKRRE